MKPVNEFALYSQDHGKFLKGLKERDGDRERRGFLYLLGHPRSRVRRSGNAVRRPL